MDTQFPVLFIGHGSPMNALFENDFTASLKSLAHEIPRPKAIVVVSAHWITKGLQVTSGIYPKQIYDFYSFPDEMYNISYPCQGSVAAARLVMQAVKSIQVTANQNRGIDHAAWAVLKHMYPMADIPVIELSIDLDMPPETIRAVAGELKSLRSNEILIIGSGNMVHNLRFMEPEIDHPPYEWAIQANDKLHALILDEKMEILFHIDELDKDIRKGIPSPDHYMPMLYTLGLKEENDTIRFFHRGIQHASVSMASFIIG